MIVLPDCHEELRSIAKEALQRADAFGKLPTPIDDVLEAHKIKLIPDSNTDREGFLASLKGKSRRLFQGILHKLRGVADTRRQAVWVASRKQERYTLFPKAHELSHQIIPWHQLDPSYFDTAATFSIDAKNIFEREANFTAGEIIFQSDSFRSSVMSYAASFEAVFSLAELYGATYQSTIWRYVEEQDEIIAVIQYYPSGIFDTAGKKMLSHASTIPSGRFRNKYADIEIPLHLDSYHPWAAAVNTREICHGTDRLSHSGSTTIFSWESWWNTYTLFVLLRRVPKLTSFGGVIRPSVSRLLKPSSYRIRPMSPTLKRNGLD